MKKIKGTKGITLVALVLTIIILLILAGITIGQLTKNGLFERAKQAKQNSIDAQELENSALLDYEKQIDDIVGNKKEVEETDIYVKLYSDGTLIFSSKDTIVEEKTVANEYNNENIRGKVFTNATDNAPLWYSDRENITSIEVIDEIVPISTAYWFNGCSKITSMNLNNLNTTKVTDMSYMFIGCSSLTKLDVSKFNTSNATNMIGMFASCQSLIDLDVSGFNTSKVTDMSSMFNTCQSLTNLNLSKFNTTNVVYMGSMFYKCANLTSLDLSSFDTSNVTSMSQMFGNCSNLTKIYVSSKWTEANVTNKDKMFDGCGVSEVTLK